MKNNRIKVLFFIDSFRIGGMHRQVLYLVQHLDKGKFEPIVCSQSQHGGLHEQFQAVGCTLIDLKWNGRGSLAILYRLIKVLYKYRPDIIFIAQAPNLIYYRFAKFFVSKRIIQIGSFRALTFWLGHENKYYLYLDNILAKWLYTTSDHVVVNTQALCDNYSRILHIGGKKSIKIINNGSDFNFPVSMDPAAMRHELKIKPSEIIIVMIARLDPWKDFETLINAARRVVNEDQRAKFLIIGDGELRPVIEEKINNLNLNKHILMIGERVDIYNYINLADISVLSTNGEGFSNSILESMAFGKPVIATDVGGNRELIGDTKTYGLLIPPKSPDLFAEGILYYLQNEEMRKGVGLAAKNRIEELCSIDKHVASYEKFFQDIVLHRGQKAASS